MVYTFTDNAYREISQLVDKHIEAKGGKWGRISYGSPTERITGFQAEFAVAKHLGIRADVNSYAISDSGADFVINNNRVSVRSSENAHYNLLVRPEEETKVDFFVFCVSIPRIVEIKGWISVEQYLELRGAPRDPGKRGKPCYIIPQEKLNSWETLRAAVSFERLPASPLLTPQVPSSDPLCLR